MDIEDQQLIDSEADLELKIEETRIDLMMSILKGSANRWFPSLVAYRAERIANRAIDYIYYDEE